MTGIISCSINSLRDETLHVSFIHSGSRQGVCMFKAEQSILHNSNILQKLIVNKLKLQTYKLFMFLKLKYIKKLSIIATLY